MVLRRDGRGVLAVGQAAHAWLCGQLARAWGNARFGAVAPRDEVALGAEQHDLGMAEWDLEPPRNPRTGLPYAFTEMPVRTGLELWLAGPSRLVTQSRYAALLAVMHGRRLYELRDLEAAPPVEVQAVRGFLERSREAEQALAVSLRADPATAPTATAAVIARNSQLVWTWDSLSLGVLLDWAPFTLRDVPTAGEGTVDIAVGTDHTLAPWPFLSDRVALHTEGRRLDAGGYETETAYAAALAAAPFERVTFELAP